MKTFLLLSLFALSAAASAAEVQLPDQVLALMASLQYGSAWKDAQSALASDKNLEQQLMVVGYELEEHDGVSIIVGAPDDIWPTSIYKIGKIHAKAVDFPDGVNRYRVENVNFQALPAPVSTLSDKWAEQPGVHRI